MTEEPYRWLEAIANRREYIREQLKGGTPVFALSRPEGILLLGVGHGHSKVFEIYDRHALAVLGHPVDIEKVRQAAIEAAHLEGFNRSSRDVTLRRLISFALSAQLKNAFEQIFAPPIMVESIFAELGETPADDVLVRVNFDGKHRYENPGLVVAHPEPKLEEDATRWLIKHVQTGDSIERCVGLCLAVWKALSEERPLGELAPPAAPSLQVDDRKVEAALLDRARTQQAKFRVLTFP
jgi:proteasome alpha subunit